MIGLMIPSAFANDLIPIEEYERLPLEINQKYEELVAACMHVSDGYSCIAKADKWKLNEYQKNYDRCCSYDSLSVNEIERRSNIELNTIKDDYHKKWYSEGLYGTIIVYPKEGLLMYLDLTSDLKFHANLHTWKYTEPFRSDVLSELEQMYIETEKEVRAVGKNPPCMYSDWLVDEDACQTLLKGKHEIIKTNFFTQINTHELILANADTTALQNGLIEIKIIQESAHLDDIIESEKSAHLDDIIESEKSSVPETQHFADTIESEKSSGGGCLIATAAFGSEMAPQVQFLRELRDNTVLQTQSGTTFMTGFNQFYYSFSPAVADLERENPVFKEAVKLTLTPLLTSLTLLNYVDIDTESEMLGYGIGVILLNIGMYFIAPAVLIKRIFYNLSNNFP